MPWEYILATIRMATYKEKTIHLTVLSIGVGAMFIAVTTFKPGDHARSRLPG